MRLRVPLKEILARELLSSGARYFIQLQLLHRPLPCRPAAPPPRRPTTGPALPAQDSSTSHSLHAALKGVFSSCSSSATFVGGPLLANLGPAQHHVLVPLRGALCDSHHHVHYRSQAPSSKPIEGKGFELQPPRPAQRNTVHTLQTAWWGDTHITQHGGM